MILPDINVYLIVLPAIFVAGVVDSVAGGGGLISLPAYLAAGLPPHIALGNNKFSSVFGTSLTTVRYFRAGLITGKISFFTAFWALLGSFIGARSVLLLDPAFLRWIMVVLVPLMAVFVILKPRLGLVDTSKAEIGAHQWLFCALAGLTIGFYDGFFGPGTGNFYVIFYTTVLGFNFARANANTKVANLASNVAAITTFIANGNIIYAIGIPAVACGMAGNWVGSHLVIKKGSKFIRPVFIGMLLLLFAKIGYDLLK